ncbi:MAG: helix-turn-helix transcriptional regulator [Porphyromonadaceae bacterium]|nr:helix-turn-helix transcriptional regulator [Porphyromonadaceae bacterium]
MKDFIDREAISARLRQILDESEMNAKEFATRMEIAQATLSQIVTGKTLINLETINKVIRYAPRSLSEFNTLWFLFGEVSPIASDDLLGKTNMSDTARIDILVKQAEELGKLRAELEQTKPKEIDRIVVFYTDNSIATYTLTD